MSYQAITRLATGPNNNNLGTVPILRPPQIPPGPYFHNGAAHGTIKHSWMTENDPDLTFSDLEIKSCLLLAPEHSQGDFRLWLSAAIAKHCSYRSIYNRNPLAKALFTQTIAEFTGALRWMINANTDFAEGEEELKEKELELSIEAFAADPRLFDASLEANGCLLEELFIIWPELPNTGGITATKDEIVQVKRLFCAEFIDLGIMAGMILHVRSLTHTESRKLERLKYQAIRFMETAYVEAENET